MTAAVSSSTGAMLTAGAGGKPIRVVLARFLARWKGAWIMDLDLDPEPNVTVPTSGSATLTIGAATLQGTIDPQASGRFVSSVGVRLVAGAGGWDQPVGQQDFANDAGIQSADVETSTAMLVGETVQDSAPIVLGLHWTRAAGPASRVFEDPDRDWYVDLAGVTQVASRPTATPDATLEILHYDPITQCVEVSCDAIILPGTTLTDARFDGTLTVRTVEQIFSKDGSRASLWCSNAAVDPLMAALTSLVRELGGVATLRVVPYRVQTTAGAQLNVQAVDKAQGQPDLQKLTVWGGMPGDSAKFAPSTGVLVVFLEGQKSKPAAIAYDGTVPLERTIDAMSAVHVGPSASAVDIAGGQQALVLAPPYQQLLVALNAFATSLSALTTAPLIPVGTAGATLLTALGALPPPATTKVTGV